LARDEEHAMNTSAADKIVVELAEEYEPAEALVGWAERTSDVD
jgi:hypothetical protein